MRKASAKDILFQEDQRFRQVWLWVMLLALAGVFWAGFLRQVVFRVPFGDRPAPDLGLVLLLLVVGIGMPLFFRYLRLRVWVLPDRLCLQFRPFHRKPVEFRIGEIKEAEAITYNPLLDYGGWGIRWGLKGKAYNVYGTRGVKLHFYNRRPLLIGSQRPEELVQAIQDAKDLLRQQSD